MQVGGRERPSTSGQPLTADTLQCPLPQALAAADLVLLGDLCHVFLQPDCIARWVSLSTGPHPRHRTPFLVCTTYPVEMGEHIQVWHHFTLISRAQAVGGVSTALPQEGDNSC